MNTADSAGLKRRKLTVEGLVQGVGFRPFVFVLAERFALVGHVLNNSRGVEIEVEGPRQTLQRFERALTDELPPLAHISRLQGEDLPLSGDSAFVIKKSDSLLSRKAQITPDANVCPDCLGELRDPQNRRYRYPFINCTHCGPRYTIVKDIPYDRPKTTMQPFPMCEDCQKEYDDPLDRRFHAQPNACPVCGPQVAFYDRHWQPLPVDDPIAEAIYRLKQGQILAIKGLGGYHLAVDAENAEAVGELRRRKARDEKPFALMVADLETVKELAHVDEQETTLLESVQRPIVLLKKRQQTTICDEVAPRNGYYGVMLPGTPLHYLLFDGGFKALVMTSGNLSDEPIAFGDEEAKNRLADIADGFLGHDRAIHVRTDDSIVRKMAGSSVVLRRSRGFVPRAVYLPHTVAPVLAVGAELKNTVCLTQDDRAFVSHHIGDLKNAETVESFAGAIDHLQTILEVKAEVIAHDLHPDYASSRYAQEQTDIPTFPVQHHHAHLVSCMAENGVVEPTLGVIFDGIGYGDDGHIWGGEFLLGDAQGYQRLGHFDYVPMPGGDRATKQPYRMALSYLLSAYGADALPPLPLLEKIPAKELTLLQQMIERGIQSPLTSSCGRLFDGVAALVGLRSQVNYEGQAALELEQSFVPDSMDRTYPVELELREGQWLFVPAATIRAVVDDVLAGVSAGVISGRFHRALGTMVCQLLQRLRKETGVNRVAFSGGVFQNRLLTEDAAHKVRGAGFELMLHGEIPPNDGGLALGQAVIAGAQRTERPVRG